MDILNGIQKTMGVLNKKLEQAAKKYRTMEQTCASLKEILLETQNENKKIQQKNADLVVAYEKKCKENDHLIQENNDLKKENSMHIMKRNLAYHELYEEQFKNKELQRHLMAIQNRPDKYVFSFFNKNEEYEIPDLYNRIVNLAHKHYGEQELSDLQSENFFCGYYSLINDISDGRFWDASSEYYKHLGLNDNRWPKQAKIQLLRDGYEYWYHAAIAGLILLANEDNRQIWYFKIS